MLPPTSSADGSSVQAASRLASDVLLLRQFPPPLLLPHCAAVVTHAGIGTVSQSLNAGTPLLSVPHFGDQFDNADRLERLGVGRSILPRDRNVPVITAALARILDDPECGRKASHWPARLAGERPAERLLSILEGSPAIV